MPGKACRFISGTNLRNLERQPGRSADSEPCAKPAASPSGTRSLSKLIGRWPAACRNLLRTRDLQKPHLRNRNRSSLMMPRRDPLHFDPRAAPAAPTFTVMEFPGVYETFDSARYSPPPPEPLVHPQSVTRERGANEKARRIEGVRRAETTCEVFCGRTRNPVSAKKLTAG
jgi:hypothetical protein